MLATWVDLGRESSSGGLDKQSVNTFSLPATCLMSDIYSTTYLDPTCVPDVSTDKASLAFLPRCAK